MPEQTVTTARNQEWKCRIRPRLSDPSGCISQVPVSVRKPAQAMQLLRRMRKKRLLDQKSSSSPARRASHEAASRGLLQKRSSRAIAKRQRPRTLVHDHTGAGRNKGKAFGSIDRLEGGSPRKSERAARGIIPPAFGNKSHPNRPLVNRSEDQSSSCLGDAYFGFHGVWAEIKRILAKAQSNSRLARLGLRVRSLRHAAVAAKKIGRPFCAICAPWYRRFASPSRNSQMYIGRIPTIKGRATLNGGLVDGKG